MLGDLPNLEAIIIENAGEISSIDFLSNLPNLKEVRFIGKTYVKDNRIKQESFFEDLVIGVGKGGEWVLFFFFKNICFFDVKFLLLCLVIIARLLTDFLYDTLPFGTPHSGTNDFLGFGNYWCSYFQ